MRKKTEEVLSAYIDALYSIIYFNHFDENVADKAIECVGMEVKCVEFNNALGIIDFQSKNP